MSRPGSRRMDPGIKMLACFAGMILIGALALFAFIATRPPQDLCLDSLDDPGCANGAMVQERPGSTEEPAADALIPATPPSGDRPADPPKIE